MKRTILGVLIGMVLSAAVLVSVAVFAQDGIAAFVRPLIVDVQQVVPVLADVVVPLEDGTTVTATVPLTLNVALQVSLSGVVSESVDVVEETEPEVTIIEPTPNPSTLATSGATGIDELGISYRVIAPEGVILQEWSAEERENGDLVYDFIISTPGKKFASDVSVIVDYYDEDDKEIGHAKTVFLGSETAQDRERIYDGRMSCDWGNCPDVLTTASYYVIEFEVDLIDFP